MLFQWSESVVRMCARIDFVNLVALNAKIKTNNKRKKKSSAQLKLYRKKTHKSQKRKWNETHCVAQNKRDNVKMVFGDSLFDAYSSIYGLNPNESRKMVSTRPKLEIRVALIHFWCELIYVAKWAVAFFFLLSIQIAREDFTFGQTYTHSTYALFSKIGVGKE